MSLQSLRLPVFLLLGLATSSVRGQPAEEPKEYSFQGQVKGGVHTLTLEANQLYRIQVAGAFAPELMIEFHSLRPVRVADNLYETFFIPSAMESQRLTVVSAGDEPSDKLLDYAVRIEQLQRSTAPALTFEEKLTKKSKRGVGYFKQFPVSLAAGKSYFFEFGAENRSASFRVRDAEGDDIEHAFSSGSENHLLFKPTDDGEHFLSIHVYSDEDPTVKILGSIIDTEHGPAKVQTAKGQVKVGRHLVNVKADQLYAVRITSLSRTEVSFGEPSPGRTLEKTKHLAPYTPRRSHEELLVVRPACFGATGHFDGYKLSLEPLQRDGKPLFDAREKLPKRNLAAAPGDDGKVIPLSLVAGQRYFFEVKGGKSGTTKVEVFEPGTDTAIAMTYQSHSEGDAQILIEAQKTGEYRLVVGDVSEREREVSIGAYRVSDWKE